MNVTTQRRFLSLLACGLLAGTLGVAAWSLSSIQVSGPNVVKSGDPAEPQDVPSDTDPKADRNDQLLSKSLRGPLYDPPKRTPPPPKPPRSVTPKVVKAPPAPKPPELTLTGTIKRNQRQLAIISDAANKFDVKGVGERLELTPEGVTITTIEENQITVSYQGRESTLTLDKKIKPGAGNKSNRNNTRKRNR
jgi:type II secretory pathway component PulC